MCGITGYVGSCEAVSLVLEGLKRLEYRGCDFAGFVVIVDLSPTVEKSAGSLRE